MEISSGETLNVVSANSEQPASAETWLYLVPAPLAAAMAEPHGPKPARPPRHWVMFAGK